MASERTTAGFLPPHSRIIFFKLLCPENSKNNRPTSVDPVKEIASISKCLPIGSPTSGPSPGRTLRTPGGIPASVASSATLSAVIDVCSAGLTITLLPPASAGAIFQASIIKGKFQGSTQPTTPNGSRVMRPTASTFAGEI